MSKRESLGDVPPAIPVAPTGGLYDPRFERDSCGVGFVADIEGRRSNDIVRQGLEIVVNLRHRGAKGAEENTGDGAGILLQMPDEFLRAVCQENGLPLPDAGDYGVGVVFLPVDDGDSQKIQALVEDAVYRTGQRLLGWRDVPVDYSMLGRTARAAAPRIRHVFIGRGDGTAVEDFERRLLLARKRMQFAIEKSSIPGRTSFYVASMSARTISYKGMLSAEQLEPCFPDLQDSRVKSALALVHQRFSTNTFPSWPLAQPFRYLAHNGEINTLLGNINWMRAREGLFESDLFGDDIKDLFPVVREGGSDSAVIDNALEMLMLGGRSLPHAVMMLIPEAWDGHNSMSDEKKAFYEYHACLMEAWDGPASIAFTDGSVIGAVLDRNGLRPSRYYVTKGGLVVMASEVGVLEIPPENIERKGRLEPGKMFLIDTREGRIIEAIDPSKDVDGFHPMSVGRLATDSGDFFSPCTPAGVVEMLIRSGNDPSGKHVVVVGRSNIVGRPLASLLLRKGPGGNATVTVCHSRTRDLGSVTRSADILVVAMGRPEMITAEMVSPGTVVIDVGTNRVEDSSSDRGYRVCGDVLFDEVKNVASAISPVPGGVGPMTITMLLSNTVKSATPKATSGV